MDERGDEGARAKQNQADALHLVDAYRQGRGVVQVAHQSEPDASERDTIVQRADRGNLLARRARAGHRRCQPDGQHQRHDHDVREAVDRADVGCMDFANKD